MTYGLVFADVGALHLFLGKCPNGHRHIFGFAHQMRGTIDTDAMTLTTVAACKECGCEVRRVDRLKWSAELMFGGAGI